MPHISNLLCSQQDLSAPQGWPPGADAVPIPTYGARSHWEKDRGDPAIPLECRPIPTFFQLDTFDVTSLSQTDCQTAWLESARWRYEDPHECLSLRRRDEIGHWAFLPAILPGFGFRGANARDRSRESLCFIERGTVPDWDGNETGPASENGMSLPVGTCPWPRRFFSCRIPMSGVAGAFPFRFAMTTL